LPKAKNGEISPFCFAKRRIRHIIAEKMYYLYILLNEAKTRTYTGVSDNVDERLKEHNSGKVKSSNPYRLYKVIHTESFATLSEAMQKEKYYKSATGRRRLKEMLFE
jgi:putative endonuclease